MTRGARRRPEKAEAYVSGLSGTECSSVSDRDAPADKISRHAARARSLSRT